MRVLADEGKIAEAQKVFEEVVAGVADERRLTDIRHPHGHLQAQVYWVSSAGLWAYFGFPPDGKSPGKRYWNAFGLEKPSNSVSIMCEINPPVRGVYRCVRRCRRRTLRTAPRLLQRISGVDSECLHVLSL